MRDRITDASVSMSSARFPPLLTWIPTAVANSFRSTLSFVDATLLDGILQIESEGLLPANLAEDAAERLAHLLRDQLKRAGERAARAKGPGGNAERIDEMPLEPGNARGDPPFRHHPEYRDHYRRPRQVGRHALRQAGSINHDVAVGRATRLVGLAEVLPLHGQ